MHYVLVPSISFLITITLNSKIRGNVMKWLDEAIMISILQSLFRICHSRFAHLLDKRGLSV